MAMLEELTAGRIVTGIHPNESVSIVSTHWYGTASVEIFYKTNQGTTGTQILYRFNEPELAVQQKSLP